jgi:hypothetical protein
VQCFSEGPSCLSELKELLADRFGLAVGGTAQQ